MNTPVTPLVFRCFLLLTAALVPNSVMAGVELLARDSQLTATSLIGGGPDLTAGGASEEETATDQRLSLQIQGQDEDSGVVSGQSWSASMNFAAQHSFAVTEDSDGVTALSGSGNSNAGASQSGVGAATALVTGPGNTLELQFVVVEPTDYNFNAQAMDDGGGSLNAASVSLARKSIGDTWAPFVLAVDGSASENGTLAPDIYRVFAKATAEAANNSGSGQASFSFSLTFSVPPADDDPVVDPDPTNPNVMVPAMPTVVMGALMLALLFVGAAARLPRLSTTSLPPLAVCWSVC